jgi:hypothetical protein
MISMRVTARETVLEVSEHIQSAFDTGQPDVHECPRWGQCAGAGHGGVGVGVAAGADGEADRVNPCVRVAQERQHSERDRAEGGHVVAQCPGGVFRARLAAGEFGDPVELLAPGSGTYDLAEVVDEPCGVQGALSLRVTAAVVVIVPVWPDC